MSALLMIVAGVIPQSRLLAQAPAHQQSALSVVQITCRLSSGEFGASGFVWSRPDYIVTALHAVAGCEKISVYSEAKKDGDFADIVAVHHRSDLALLKLRTDLDLIPLKHRTAPANFDQEHYIWGYPHAIPSMQENRIQFSRTLQAPSTLKDLFKGPRDFQKQVGSQGYPKLDVKILRVGSTIQPGHSGAPIFDRDGLVVAIADGGLKKGIAGINWAIPAAEYLPGLERSADQLPRQPSKQAQLFSTYAAKEPLVVRAGPTTDPGKDLTLHLSWSAPVTEVREFVPDDDREYIDGIIATLEEVARDADLKVEDFSIDVYEDYQSGATVAVPHGIAFDYSSDLGLLNTSTENKSVGMVIQVREQESQEAAMEELRVFDGYIESLADWRASPDYEDLADLDSDGVVSFLDKQRIVTDVDGYQVSSLFATLRIEENTFFGTAVYHLKELPLEDEMQFYLLAICEQLASFSVK